jgi:hypothetical protein
VSRAVQGQAAPASAVRWQSGRLRVVQHDAQPPRLEVFDGPDGEAPEWYVPALPWATEPAVSALVQEFVFALAREGGCYVRPPCPTHQAARAEASRSACSSRRAAASQ